MTTQPYSLYNASRQTLSLDEVNLRRVGNPGVGLKHLVGRSCQTLISTQDPRRLSAVCPSPKMMRSTHLGGFLVYGLQSLSVTLVGKAVYVLPQA